MKKNLQRLQKTLTGDTTNVHSAEKNVGFFAEKILKKYIKPPIFHGVGEGFQGICEGRGFSVYSMSVCSPAGM